MDSTATASNTLPSGKDIFKVFPERFLSLEFVCGGLVWILIACIRVPYPQLQGWVMFVSVPCFVCTGLSTGLAFTGSASRSHPMWPTVEFAYHTTAAALYLSATVPQAFVTSGFQHIPAPYFYYYQFNLAATATCATTTVLYAIHAVYSAQKWKTS